MTVSSLDLASLLCSRLCHDLLSPVGAMTNGLELIAEEKDPEMRRRCFDLLEQSARISADKLKFFRLAFGAAGGYGDMVQVEEARSVVDALAGNNGRIEVNWSVGLGGIFAFNWRELDGPVTSEPTSHGFGSVLIRQVVASYFDGTATLNILPQGAVFFLDGRIGMPESAGAPDPY